MVVHLSYYLISLYARGAENVQEQIKALEGRRGGVRHLR
jgi:hypothetical protein